MALHRRVYLIGALGAVLIFAFATVGLVAFRSQGSRATALIDRSAAQGLLGAAQEDIGTSQLQLGLASPGQQTASTLAALPRALAQQQKGEDEWRQYKVLVRRWGPLPQGSAQLDSDLARLGTLSGPSSSSASEPSTVSALSLSKQSVLAEQTDVDFGTVRGAEQAWWTAQLSEYRTSIAHDIQWFLAVAGLALTVTVVGNGLLGRAARRRDAELAERDHDLERVANANEFEARLQRALEMSSTEDRVFEIVGKAFNEAVPDLSVEMLLADSSQAHFQQFVTTGTEPTHRCSVQSPADCPAAQRGEVLTFVSSLALDACPYLNLQPDPCSATCVPVSVSGMSVGVVHAAGADESPPNTYRRAALELVARRASDRIGLMRAFSRSEVQASVDSLTGLPNRRSLEENVRRLDLAGTPYAVAFGDLDRFKQVNDVYGHSAGDHALRVFAHVLRDGLRPDDMPGRFGGEEFVVILPNCDETQAVRVLDRIREELVIQLMASGSPPFTVSFGLACAQAGQRFEDMVRTADAALLEAKALGRNQVVVAGPQNLSSTATSRVQ